MATTTVGPFTIKELGGEERVIELVGRALPYRPFPLRTEQRVKIVWLPGAPEATSTVLGAKEGPTSVSGMWKQRFLDTTGDTGVAPPFRLDNEEITEVFKAIDIIDEFVRHGQLMEVTWLTTRRIGHFVAFDYQWENLNDVAWTMDFEWVSRDEVPGAAVFAGNVSASDTVGVLESRFNLLDAIKFPDTFGLTTDFVGGYRDLVNGIGDLILDLQTGLVQFTNKVLTPVQVTRGLIATLKSIEDEASLVLEFFGAQVAQNFNNTNGIGSLVFSDSHPSAASFREQLEAERYRRENEAWAREMRIVAKQHRDELLKNIQGELAGTYVARQGEDLRDVSRFFYKTPFEWRRIMIFNNMRVSELEAGQIVLVPRFSPDQTNQLSTGV